MGGTIVTVEVCAYKKHTPTLLFFFVAGWGSIHIRNSSPPFFLIRIVTLETVTTTKMNTQVNIISSSSDYQIEASPSFEVYDQMERMFHEEGDPDSSEWVRPEFEDDAPDNNVWWQILGYEPNRPQSPSAWSMDTVSNDTSSEDEEEDRPPSPLPSENNVWWQILGVEPNRPPSPSAWSMDTVPNDASSEGEEEDGDF